MKETIEALKYMCSDESGTFQPTELAAGICVSLIIPTFWILAYALGAR